jgi:hypothetical protein
MEKIRAIHLLGFLLIYAVGNSNTTSKVFTLLLHYLVGFFGLLVCLKTGFYYCSLIYVEEDKAAAVKKLKPELLFF